MRSELDAHASLAEKLEEEMAKNGVAGLGQTLGQARDRLKRSNSALSVSFLFFIF